MKQISLDLLGFLFTLAAAFYFSWQSADVVWGLWISSLLVGYSRICHRALGIGKAAGAVHPSAGVAAALFFMLFFTVHFGMFHYVHSIFLEQFFPLPGRAAGNPANIFSTIYLALGQYWPMVLGGFIVVGGRSADEGTSASTATSPQRLLRNEQGKMGDIYGSVVRMHLLIFAMAFLHAAHLERLGIVVVLLFFFFPFKELLESLRAGRK